jgi:hypothetical protein
MPKSKPKPKAMTVAQLIAALKKMPQDKLVEIATEQDGDDIYINAVEVQGSAVVLNCCDEDTGLGLEDD